MRKGAFSIVVLAVLGLVLALALGAFAHTIARSTVALPSTTLQRADEALAPPQAGQAKRVATPKKKPAKKPARTTGTTTTTQPTATTGDDHGGRGRGSDDSSGKGSSGSGKGSDDVDDD
jgi:hypothetical protein